MFLGGPESYLIYGVICAALTEMRIWLGDCAKVHDLYTRPFPLSLSHKHQSRASPVQIPIKECFKALFSPIISAACLGKQGVHVFGSIACDGRADLNDTISCSFSWFGIQCYHLGFQYAICSEENLFYTNRRSEGLTCKPNASSAPPFQFPGFENFSVWWSTHRWCR